MKISGTESLKEIEGTAEIELKGRSEKNGLGNGRTLDKNGEFTYDSKQLISPNSRRVEFKVVTTSDELIEEIISKQKNNN